MLHFLHPIWLLAGSGIVIPVIIHLLNIKKGKVLRIGSTSLMKEATQKSASRLRISQWLLLVLRCLLIIAFSMLLAIPQWRKSLSGSGKGWVVIEKGRLGQIYQEYKTPIDSLIKAGYEPHEFGNGFNKLDLSDTSASSRDTTTENGSYWTLISELDRQLPAGFPVHVFSSDMSYKPGGDGTNSGLSVRPAVSLDLRWSMLESDSVSTIPFPVNLRQLSNGNYQMISLLSNPEGNYFVKTMVNAGTSSGLQADTTVKNITIYNSNNAEDARYLGAAIKAISSFGKYKINLTSTQRIQEIPARQDWLFWLSDETPASNFQASNLFMYQPGKPVNTRSWITTEDGPTANDAIKTYKLIDFLTNNRIDSTTNNRIGSATDNLSNSDSNHVPAKMLWRDGFGNSLLTVENGSTNVYRFYSRFDPAWSDLSWQAAFPKILYPILIADPFKDKAGEYDRRRMAPEQAMPTVKNTTFKEDRTAFEIIPLDKILWIIAFLLFVAERFISLNAKNSRAA